MIKTARKELGTRIRALRMEQNLTLRGFALMIGISKDYLVDLEYGRKSPTFDTIMKIAGGLDISPSQLLKGIGEPPEQKQESGSAQGTEIRYHFTNL